MKKQGNLTPPKVHNSSITEFKDIEMLDKKFKTIVLKMINDFKKNSSK
jgi:hypothetical protein